MNQPSYIKGYIEKMGELVSPFGPPPAASIVRPPAIPWASLLMKGIGSLTGIPSRDTFDFEMFPMRPGMTMYDTMRQKQNWNSYQQFMHRMAMNSLKNLGRSASSVSNLLGFGNLPGTQ